MDKKLFVVNIEYTGDIQIPVYAEDGDEAESIARDSVLKSDIEFDTWSTSNEMKELSYGFKNETPEGLKPWDNRTCEQIFNEDHAEQRKWEVAESWPKLPGFSETVQVT